LSHRFTFTVTVEVNRTSGKFASRDEIAEAIISEIEGTDPGSLDGLGADGESEYEVESWEVEETPEPPRARR
jgi:hypothetical protein